MSHYNDDCICMECDSNEHKRKDYPTASEAEQSAVKLGDLNFPGVALTAEELNMIESEPLTNSSIDFSGENGNAFWILGKLRRILQDTNCNAEYIESTMKRAKSGDYEHLLEVVGEFVHLVR